MLSRHRLIHGDATRLDAIGPEEIDLVVTSPPYPMIAMWDEMFADQDDRIGRAIEAGDGRRAFALMHGILDRVWRECFRVLKPGGFLCVNVGDAVRSVAGEFSLYTNHARVTTACEEIGFSSLPAIHWFKPTNAPNKFMGSGMLPAGAYVTLEHEYVLIFRKGGKRVFTGADRARRRRSAFFWEERNRWFSDTWDFKGVLQAQSGDHRARSAAFPLELAFRVVNMYSLVGDTVLDPFCGTGTTTRAAIAGARSSIGYEIDRSLLDHAREVLARSASDLNERQRRRLQEHEEFLAARLNGAGDRGARYTNRLLDTPVVTSQERDMAIPLVAEMTTDADGTIVVRHKTAGANEEDGGV